MIRVAVSGDHTPGFTLIGPKVNTDFLLPLDNATVKLNDRTHDF